MKKLNKLMFLSLSLLVIFGISGCSKDSGVDISNQDIYRIIEEELGDNDIQVSNFEIFNVKNVDITKEDSTELKETYPQKVPVFKGIVEFAYESIESNSKGFYELTAVYHDSQWKKFDINKAFVDEWEYNPRTDTQIKTVLDDLRKDTFEGFEDGYIGDEEVTQVSLKNRKTDKDNLVDEFDMTINVRTEFAKYKIEARAKYNFNDGYWKREDIQVESKKFWAIDYIDGANIPELPKDEDIIKELFNKDNYINYIANKDFVDDYKLGEAKEIANLNTINYEYDFNINYKGFAKVNYKISVPYEWIGKAWNLKDMSVEISDYDFSEIPGVYKDKDSKSTVEIKKAADKYTLHLKDSNGEISSNIELKAYMRDDNWEVESDNKDLANPIISLKNKSIVINNIEFKK